jgi:surfactin synthase thioesterase subunit
MAIDLPKKIGRHPSLNAPIAILLGKDDSILDRRGMKKIRGRSRELVSGGQMLPIAAVKETADFIG